MRPDFAASAIVASAMSTDSATLKRAIRRFLAHCKAERLPPAEILLHFEAFLATYNRRQKRFLRSSTQPEGAPSRLGPGSHQRTDSVPEGKRAPRAD